MEIIIKSVLMTAEYAQYAKKNSGRIKRKMLKSVILNAVLSNLHFTYSTWLQTKIQDFILIKKIKIRLKIIEYTFIVTVFVFIHMVIKKMTGLELIQKGEQVELVIILVMIR